MDRQSLKKKTPRKKNRSWSNWSGRSNDPYNSIDAFENFVRSRSRERLYGAVLAIGITVFIFMYAFYYRNFLVCLIVVAVWVLWRDVRNSLESRLQNDFNSIPLDIVRYGLMRSCLSFIVDLSLWISVIDNVWRVVGKSFGLKLKQMTLEASVFILEETKAYFLFWSKRIKWKFDRTRKKFYNWTKTDYCI